jgi:hypothetical protein
MLLIHAFRLMRFLSTLVSFSQVTRNNVVQKGCLAYNLTEGPSPNPRWLVKFDDDNKDEELYELDFGKVVKAAEQENSLPFKTMHPPRRARTSRSSGSSDDVPNKRVTFSESSPTASDDSAADHAAKVSAREERSRLRQVKMKQAPPTIEGGTKRLMPPNNISKKNKRQKDESEEVVVVKLLTGTLYLYRGAHRRAEFVRRV